MSSYDYRTMAPPPITTGSVRRNKPRMDNDYDYGATTAARPEVKQQQQPSPAPNRQPPATPPQVRSPGSEAPTPMSNDPSIADGEEALLDLEQLEELHTEAERMKALGNKHMAAQEYTRAYNAYSAALQLSPVGPSSHVFLSNRAASLLSLKRYAAAATDARRAIALAPTFGKAHARLGQSLYFLKDYEGAVSAYEEAMQYEPDNKVTVTYLEKARNKLARQQEKMARASGAYIDTDGISTAFGEESTIADTIVNSIATDPNGSAAVVSSGGFRPSNAAIQNAVNRDHPDDEIRATASPTSIPPAIQEDEPLHEPSLGVAAAAAAAAPKNLDDENDEDDEVDDDEDPDFDEAVQIQLRANGYLANKQYKRAIEEYSAALFLVPDDPFLSPELHLGRAHGLNGARRHESARNDAQLAIKMNPTPEAYSTLAKSLFYMKDYRGSIDAFQSCMELLPEEEGLTMFDQAYLQKAQDALTEELEKNPAEIDARSTAPTIPKLPPPRFVPREEAMALTQNMPRPPKKWPQQTPSSPQAIQCGKEREILFLSESLGIKLNRGTDGIVRVVGLAPDTPASPVARKGKIEVGDVVREAAGVDIRRPITNIMWGDTVALIKLAPRPISFLVAKEISTVPPSVLEERERNAQTEISRLSSPASYSAYRGEEKREEEEVSDNSFRPSPSSGEEPVRNSVAASELNEVVEQEQNTETIDGGRNGSVAEEAEIVTEANNTSDDGNGGLEEQAQGQEEWTETVTESQSGGLTSYNEDTPDTLKKGTEEESSVPDCDLMDENIASPSLEEVEELNDECHEKENATVDFGVDEESSPPAQTKTEIDSVGSEILFQKKAAQSGWTSERWLATAGSRKLLHSGSVFKLTKVRKGLFWTGEEFVPRKLFVFENPCLILVTRSPNNVKEVQDLLDLPGDVKIAPSGNDDTVLKSFVIVESVIEPMACKLRLSSLTTVTSIETSADSKNETQRPTCFELLSPTENIILSAVMVENDNVEPKTAAEDSTAYLETSLMEAALTKSLCKAHSPADDTFETDRAWKHQIILGTLHSIVVMGNQKSLERALKAAIESSAHPNERRVNSRIIDAQDDSGRTALHYACTNRASGAVAMLAQAGANCTIPIWPGNYPSHVCARNLDAKSLATVLSASFPVRPDANALDATGRTAMYIAALEGKTRSGAVDPVAVEQCLSALEAWGGLLITDDHDQVNFTPLRHPISELAYEWRSEELLPIFSHVQYRFPIEDVAQAHDRRAGMSLGAKFHYPVHSAIVSLVMQLRLVKGGSISHKFFKQAMRPDSDLVRTLRILFEHGFESNERLEDIIDGFGSEEELALFTGFSPLQILGVAALEASHMAKGEQVCDNETMQNIVEIIRGSAEFLVQNGARLNLDPPPKTRLTRAPSTLAERSSSVELDSTDNLDDKDGAVLDRSNLKIDSNKVLMQILGGEEVLGAAKKRWSTTKSVEYSSKNILREKSKSSLSDSDAPGGNDEKSCAICWSAFGTIMNRKHTCRISQRYVCDDCSSKRVVSDGKELRVSDGQFLLAKVDAAKMVSQRLEHERELEHRRQEQARKAFSERQTHLSSSSRASDADNRDSLFGNIVEKATSLVMGEDEGLADIQSQGLADRLGQTRDALNERGDKLNTLVDKTARLESAASDFAKMAKELEKSQGGFW